MADRITGFINKGLSAALNFDKTLMNGAERHAGGRITRAVVGLGLAAGSGGAAIKSGMEFAEQLPKAVEAVQSQVGPANTGVQIGLEVGKAAGMGALTVLSALYTGKVVNDYRDYATVIGNRQTTSVDLNEA